MNDNFTPYLDHIQYTDFENVYEPSDDTFLFVDALYQELPYILSINPIICAEIGPGSGYVTSYVSNMLKNHVQLLYFAIDRNRHAAEMTYRTGLHNHVSTLEVIQDDLLTSLSNKLLGKIDILLFNPPYVPTPSSEINESDIASSYAGGENGREVIDRILPIINKLLSPNGCFYMVVVEDNNPNDIINILNTFSLKTNVYILH